MKSSDARAGTGSRWGSLAALAVSAACACGVAYVRPRAAERYQRAKVNTDVYPLPGPEQTVVASLGYRAALADALFAHVLVSSGIHHQEKRRFEFVGDYLDAINALDPTFRDPYRYADSLIALSSEAPRLQEYLKAREILRRGVRNRPYDTELWLVLGQYLAFLARPYLPNAEMKREWKLEGARALARACELANHNVNLPHQCIVAANLFDVAGEREAAIDSLKRVLAVNDDPEIERLALGYLKAKLSEREKDLQDCRRQAFREAWKGDLPFVSKDELLVLGPRFDAARCAGPGRFEDPACVTSWREWSLRNEPASTD